MKTLSQSPVDPDFVQNPYPFYDQARAYGDLFYWQDYKMVCATSHDAVSTLLRDRRFGREIPADKQPQIPAHLAPFYEVEAHSMLELEGPKHKRLRGLVLRAFTSRRIKDLGPEIDLLCHQLIDDFPAGEFDLLTTFAQKLPIIIICRLLGVPETMADRLLPWSNAMVGMYQAGRSRQDEDLAIAATVEFVAFMRGYVEQRRTTPGNDLITELISAEENGEKLSTDELITTCILLLNAGHEATVHSIGNGVKTLLEYPGFAVELVPDRIDNTVEEILRFDPPLHMFTRWTYEQVDLFGHRFQPGDQVACLLAAGNRDPKVYPTPDQFQPQRRGKANTSFGGGLHFCVGAPLARMELQIALPILFQRCPNLAFSAQAQYADNYHFHGLQSLMVHMP